VIQIDRDNRMGVAIGLTAIRGREGSQTLFFAIISAISARLSFRLRL
jgi:hypothetical protein